MDDDERQHLADSPVERRNTAAPRSTAPVPPTPPANGKAQGGAAAGAGGDLRSVLRPVFDEAYERTKTHFKARAHFDHLVQQFMDTNAINARTTVDQLVALIEANRTAADKTGRGWYQDAKVMRDLPANLFDAHMLNVEQAVARVGSLDKFTSMRAFLDAVDSFMAADKQTA